MGYPLVEKVKQDFAARHHFLMPQDQKEEGGRKGWKGKVQSQGFDRKKNLLTPHFCPITTITLSAHWTGRKGKRGESEGEHRGI